MNLVRNRKQSLWTPLEFVYHCLGSGLRLISRYVNPRQVLALLPAETVFSRGKTEKLDQIWIFLLTKVQELCSRLTVLVLSIACQQQVGCMFTGNGILIRESRYNGFSQVVIYLEHHVLRQIFSPSILGKGPPFHGNQSPHQI